MKCPAGHEAQHYRLPHPMTALPMDVYQCAACVREYVNGAWVRMAGFCAGCDQPTWRMLTHPTRGHRVLLWPKPDTMFAFLATPEGPGDTCYLDYCPACCPEFGAFPVRAVAEVGGQPVKTGACVAHESAHTKYAFHFSDRYGRWLAAHLADGYGVSDGERDTWLAQWERDRAGRACPA